MSKYHVALHTSVNLPGMFYVEVHMPGFLDARRKGKTLKPMWVSQTHVCARLAYAEMNRYWAACLN